MPWLRAGWWRVASPYGGGRCRVSLQPETIDGMLLWTRNLRPVMADLDEVRPVHRDRLSTHP